MSKYHGKRKQKRKFRKNRTMVFSPEDAERELGETILLPKKNEEDIETLETPFGTLQVNEEAFISNLKNKAILFELLAIKDMEEDYIAQLLHFEKIKEKFPNEPLIHYEISKCYNSLDQEDKYEQVVEENFNQFQGYPKIDISYVSLQFDYQEDLSAEVFGEQLNLHQIYPSYKTFDKETVTQFYALMAFIHKDRKDFKTARECAEVIEMIAYNESLPLSVMIDFAEKPWKKWRGYAVIGLILVTIISLIGGAIWGVVKFFQWIF